jgi:hypothetical protein
MSRIVIAILIYQHHELIDHTRCATFYLSVLFKSSTLNYSKSNNIIFYYPVAINAILLRLCFNC